MTTPRLLRAADSGGATRPGKARSVILFNLLGGPSHQDMFDLKPEAPAEIRGEFRPIATSVPGLQICEHLPKTARLDAPGMPDPLGHARLQHPQPAAVHDRIHGRTTRADSGPSRPTRPTSARSASTSGMGPEDLPGAVCLPCYPGWGEERSGPRRAPTADSWAASTTRSSRAASRPSTASRSRPYYDPVWPIGAAAAADARRLPELTVDRLDRRRSLLDQLDDAFERRTRRPASPGWTSSSSARFRLLTSRRRSATRSTCRSEPDVLRERYGRNLFGSSLLVARRLVEAGVPFVSVHAENFVPHGSPTTCTRTTSACSRASTSPCSTWRSPRCWRTSTSAGLLDSTLVVVMGEMGRTPRVNAKAGRDHWPQCGFCLLAGGGTRPGVVHGASDKHAAYPASDPVSPGDVVATIYHLLGIDPDMTVPDRLGRPVPIAHGGEPIRGVIL